MYASFGQMEKAVLNQKTKRVLALAGAHDKDALAAAVHAKRNNIADVVLIGKEEETKELLKWMGEPEEAYPLIPCAGEKEMARPDADFQFHAGVVRQGKLWVCTRRRIVEPGNSAGV